jgi:flavin reductase (DIM6/NTAB) family NADH-FMN oxidoreductase RutF
MMKNLPLEKAFLYIERGPVVLITTFDGNKNNIMTISWTMVKDFDAQFLFLTGPWNYSYHALIKNKECVIAVPTMELAKTVVKTGSCSGRDTDKFEKFKITPLKAEKIKAPLIKECYVNIECKITDYIGRHNIFVVKGVNAWIDPGKKEKRLIHAIGDGTFVSDGEKLNYKRIMKGKLPF